MMNVLALGLVLTSLVTAGFFTPSPEKQRPGDNVIVKEGRRVVVVEYGDDDGNTKVLISPQDPQAFERGDGKGSIDHMNDKMSERGEDVKEGMKKAPPSIAPDTGNVGSKEEGFRRGFRPRELVCDAYGKCKHKIASAIGKTTEAVTGKAHEAAEKVYEVEAASKETVVEKAHEAAEKVYEVEEGAKEAVGDAIGKVKETVTHTAHKASDKVQEAKEYAKDSASEVSSKAKKKASEKARGIKDGASRKMEGIEETVSDKAKEAGEWVENVGDRAKKGAERVKKEGEKELSEIMHRAGEVVVDVINYAFSLERVAPLTGVLHLMGFAAAYGMCVWVTFASSHVLAGALPRQQFAMVQSKIYPVYFKAMAYSVGIALLGHLMSPRKSKSSIGAGMFKVFDLMAPLGMILVNFLCLEPRATKVMLERMKKEKEEGTEKEDLATETSGRSPVSTAEIAGRCTATHEKQEAAAAKSEIIHLSEALQRLNAYSSFLNVMTLVSLTYHLACLGPLLHTSS